MTELTAREKKVIEEAAAAAVEAYGEKHPCRFDDATAQTLHEIHAAKTQEGADSNTFRIIIQFGRSVQDVTKAMRKLLIVGLILAAIAVFGNQGLSWILRWIGR